MNAVDDLIRDLGGAMPEPPKPEPFIPTRFPYTYAYDFLRAVCGVQLSRGECACAVRAWCAQNGWDDAEREGLLIALALRYCKHYGIQISFATPRVRDAAARASRFTDGL